MFTKRQLYLIERCVDAELVGNGQCDTSLSIVEEERGTDCDDLRKELIEVIKIVEEARSRQAGEGEGAHKA
jgi:hypothetical protein